MRVVVGYGAGSAELEVADDRLVALAGGALGEPLTDVSARVTAALDAPIDFPPLSRAVVPGDHVAIVLDEAIPAPTTVLEPLVDYLVHAGIQPRDIRIIAVPAQHGASGRLNGESIPPGVGFLRHDPRDRGQLSYLASTKSGERLYLNRDVVDADVVILVGRVDYHPILGYRGTSSGVFPGLADAAAQQRFRAQITGSCSAESQAERRRVVDEVAWLLGVQFAVQLIVGPGSRVVEVAAGHCSAVQRHCQTVLESSRRRTAASRADLVVAGISSAPDEQGFDELGTVLAACCEVVREGGQVAVLSAIDQAPGPSLKRASQLEEPGAVAEQVRRHPDADAISAYQIVRAGARARLYLFSRLPEDLVEDLSITPLANMPEVQRLVSRAGSCLILHDAQLVRASVAAEHARAGAE